MLKMVCKLPVSRHIITLKVSENSPAIPMLDKKLYLCSLKHYYLTRIRNYLQSRIQIRQKFCSDSTH